MQNRRGRTKRRVDTRGRMRERGGGPKGCVRGTCVRMPHPDVLLSWSPGSYKSPYLGHGAFRGSGTGCETPSCRSCCPVSENKATGIGQRTSFAYFSAKIESSRRPNRRFHDEAKNWHVATRCWDMRSWYERRLLGL